MGTAQPQGISFTGIEDVPYVMYFYRSYAVHGAFWHRDYGFK